jgi:two-component system sensor histidine kinase BaeS
VMVAGITLRGAWLPRAAVLTGAGALLGIALVNPDAWIAEHNLDRYEETGRVDWSYLQGLSTDVVPALEDRPDDVVDCVLLRDAEVRLTRETDDDWLEWNIGRSRAEDMLQQVSVEALPTCVSSD